MWGFVTFYFWDWIDFFVLWVKEDGDALVSAPPCLPFNVNTSSLHCSQMGLLPWECAAVLLKMLFIPANGLLLRSSQTCIVVLFPHTVFFLIQGKTIQAKIVIPRSKNKNNKKKTCKNVNSCNVKAEVVTGALGNYPSVFATSEPSCAVLGRLHNLSALLFLDL